MGERKSAFLKQAWIILVTLSEKGQIVIPKEARTMFGIEPGDTLLILGDDASGILISRPEVVSKAANEVFKKMEEEQ